MKYYLMFPFFFVGLCVGILWFADLTTQIPEPTPQTWEQCGYLNIDCK